MSMLNRPIRPRILGRDVARGLHGTANADFALACRQLKSQILATNWADTFQLVLDVPFFESAYDSLHQQVTRTPDVVRSQEAKDLWDDLNTLLDTLFIAEDLRDHLNEIMEALQRKNHRFANSQMRIENLDEVVQAIVTRLDHCREAAPQYNAKLQESVGKGLNLLRMHQRFDWPGLHQAYY